MLLLADVRMDGTTQWAILIADKDTFKHSPLFAIPHFWSLACHVLYLSVLICISAVRLVGMLDTSVTSSL